MSWRTNWWVGKTRMNHVLLMFHTNLRERERERERERTCGSGKVEIWATTKITEACVLNFNLKYLHCEVFGEGVRNCISFFFFWVWETSEKLLLEHPRGTKMLTLLLQQSNKIILVSEHAWLFYFLSKG